MARIAGIDLPKDKRIEIGLTYIYGIGLKTSRDILVLLEEINAKYGTTMLIVTHNNSIKNMVHKVIFIKDGLISKEYENEVRVPASELEDL